MFIHCDPSWFSDQIFTSNKIATNAAKGYAYAGRLESLKRMEAQQTLGNYRYINKYAAKGGQKEVLLWARGKGYGSKDETWEFAVKHGDLDFLKWLKKNIADCTYDVCWAAAKIGSLEILKWLRENGSPWSKDTCMFAGAHRRWEVLKWALANGCEYDVRLLNSFASEGQLHILKWMKENGYFEPIQCWYAVAGGHMDVLEWLLDNGCPWEDRILTYALERGMLEVIVVAFDRGFLPLRQTVVSAAKYGHVNILKWAKEKGIEIDEEILPEYYAQ